MSIFQALVLALLQGVTELFPVSSLGHTVILPSLLHWNFNQADPTFLAFVVLLHHGRAIPPPHGETEPASAEQEAAEATSAK